MKKVCVIVASSGKNLELATHFQNQLSQLGAKAGIFNLSELDLPIYTPQNESKFKAQDLIAPYADQLGHDAFVFLMPEYNGNLPPAFTNFLAWTSRANKDWRKDFNGKTAAIGTFSGAGLVVLPMLRVQLSHLGMNVIGRQILVTSQKPLELESLKAVCAELLKHTLVD